MVRIQTCLNLADISDVLFLMIRGNLERIKSNLESFVRHLFRHACLRAMHAYKIKDSLKFIPHAYCCNTDYLNLACVAARGFGGWRRGVHAVTYWYFSCVAFAGERL